MLKFDSDSEHIKRLLIVIVAVVLGFVTMRLLFIPRDFGKYGHFRAGSLQENMDRPQNYAESAACQYCHEKNYTTWSNSRHKTVNCETCHGPANKHTEDPSAVKPTKPHARKDCLICHAINISKPKTFPQVSPREHFPDQICWTCHEPHVPIGGAR
ncbi:hypothetical protein HZB07_00505 [Candidatus Saganbacteria bacterium]|nr:hypothetical protein [Candidatus Saganbacteria bacterium]